MIPLETYFSKNLHKVTVSVIGCGGTGSLVLARLARMDYALRLLGYPGITVTAVDNDKVEAFNVGRQNFTPGDIGEYKSHCLIEKINFAYGLNWKAIKKKVVSKNDTVFNSNFIITCVDNVVLRKKTKVYFDTFNIAKEDYSTSYYWIDCGNGKDFGQVVLSAIKPIKKKYNLNDVFDLYGNLSEFDNEETQGMNGCSYADSIEKQDLFINDLIALEACEMIYRFLKNYYLDYSGVIINHKELKTKKLSIMKHEN